jgi:hypothetical protein
LQRQPQLGILWEVAQACENSLLHKCERAVRVGLEERIFLRSEVIKLCHSFSRLMQRIETGQHRRSGRA